MLPKRLHIHKRPPARLPALLKPQNHIFRSTQIEHKTMMMPVFRNMPQTQSAHCFWILGISRIHSLSEQSEISLLNRPHSRQSLHKRALPVPGHPCHSQNLASAQHKTNIVKLSVPLRRGTTKPLNRKTNVQRFCLPPRNRKQNRAPHHELSQLLLACLPGFTMPDNFPAPHD